MAAGHRAPGRLRTGSDPAGFVSAPVSHGRELGSRRVPAGARLPALDAPFTPPSICRPHSQPGPQRCCAATQSPPGLEITRDLILPGLHPQELFKGIFSSRDQPGRPGVGVAGCSFSSAVGQGRASSRNPPPTAGEKARQRAEAESKQMWPLRIQGSQRLPGRPCAPTAPPPSPPPARDTELRGAVLRRWGLSGRPHLPLGWRGSVNRGGSQASSPPPPRDKELRGRGAVLSRWGRSGRPHLPLGRWGGGSVKTGRVRGPPSPPPGLAGMGSVNTGRVPGALTSIPQGHRARLRGLCEDGAVPGAPSPPPGMGGGAVNRGGSRAPSPPPPRDTEPGCGGVRGGGGGVRLPRARTGLTLLNPIQTLLAQGFRVGSSVSRGSIL